ncbi:unnamed protein product, partial [Rotaria sp. Silwood1]
AVVLFIVYCFVLCPNDIRMMNELQPVRQI